MSPPADPAAGSIVDGTFDGADRGHRATTNDRPPAIVALYVGQLLLERKIMSRRGPVTFLVNPRKENQHERDSQEASG